MSKCRTAFEKFAFEAPDFGTIEPYELAVLAWNARGKVDVEIADRNCASTEVIEAIEKEQT